MSITKHVKETMGLKSIYVFVKKKDGYMCMCLCEQNCGGHVEFRERAEESHVVCGLGPRALRIPNTIMHAQLSYSLFFLSFGVFYFTILGFFFLSSKYTLILFMTKLSNNKRETIHDIQFFCHFTDINKPKNVSEVPDIEKVE